MKRRRKGLGRGNERGRERGCVLQIEEKEQLGHPKDMERRDGSQWETED